MPNRQPNIQEPNIKGDFILESKPLEYSLSLKKFNSILNQVVSLESPTKEIVDYLTKLGINNSVPDKIAQILEIEGCSEEDFLQRCHVLKRKEEDNKKKEYGILKNRAKEHFNIRMTDENEKEKIQELKKIYNRIIRSYGQSVIVKWNDNSINYIETLKSINKIDTQRKNAKKSQVELNTGRTEKTKKNKLKLLPADYRKLDISIDEALKLKNKRTLTGGVNSITELLKNRFLNEDRMHTAKAKKYFADRYFTLYDERYGKFEELYPNDREIVYVTKIIENTKERVCRVRGEKEIINLALDQYQESIQISYQDIIKDEETRVEMEKKIQKSINMYYEVLRDLEVYSYTDGRTKGEWIKLDMQAPESIISQTKDGLVAYDLDTLQSTLDINNNIKLVVSNNSNSRSGRNKTIEDIPRYLGFKSLMKQMLEYNPIGKNKAPTKIEVLQFFGFNYVTGDNVLSNIHVNFRSTPRK